MQIKKSITNPFTKYLRKNGWTLRGWAKVNSESPHMVNQVVNCGYYSPRIIKKIKDQDYYKRLPRSVRSKIKRKEERLLNKKLGVTQ